MERYARTLLLGKELTMVEATNAKEILMLLGLKPCCIEFAEHCFPFGESFYRGGEIGIGFTIACQSFTQLGDDVAGIKVIEGAYKGTIGGG